MAWEEVSSKELSHGSTVQQTTLSVTVAPVLSDVSKPSVRRELKYTILENIITRDRLLTTLKKEKRQVLTWIVTLKH